MTDNQTQPPAGNADPAVVKYELHEVIYDQMTDVLTFDGFKFTGELMRQFTATPCGTMFRIVERKDGAITVRVDHDPLGALAPRLLETLQTIVANAHIIPDPRMNGTTDTYAVPDDDIEAARAAITAAVGDRESHPASSERA